VRAHEYGAQSARLCFASSSTRQPSNAPNAIRVRLPIIVPPDTGRHPAREPHRRRSVHFHALATAIFRAVFEFPHARKNADPSCRDAVARPSLDVRLRIASGWASKARLGRPRRMTSTLSLEAASEPGRVRPRACRGRRRDARSEPGHGRPRAPRGLSGPRVTRRFPEPRLLA